jgi:minor extracellular serine protease Vpr
MEEIHVKKLFTPLVVSAAACLLVACGGGETPSASSEERVSGQAAGGAGRSANRYRVEAPAMAEAARRIDVRLRNARGPVDVWVSLEQNSVAAQRAGLAEAAGITDRTEARTSSALSAGLRNHRQRIHEAQSGVAGRLSSLGARELTRVQTAHNAIAVRIDASQLTQVASLSGVAKVRPVIHYEMALSDTVPYVGAATVQNNGRDGTGVTVAVLDSGIDYTHRNLGGAGTTAAYAAAYGADPADPKNTTLDGLFPTAKVVGGFDFVGETWGVVDGAEIGTRTEDPDPIDFGGHGTHVADIIGGKSTDGAHKGVAPGAKLVAVKVCSAVTTACNGVALIKAMDFALDPNGDGDTDDAVDVINMSLGSAYGQVEDDLSAASANAVRLGVVVVAAAGNDANLPYVVSSPSNATGVISVAQTQVPSAVAIPLVVNAPAAIAGVYSNTATVDWAPVGSGVTGDVVFIGRGCPAGSIAPGSPADPLLNSPAGKIALIDRGACSVSLKVDVAVKAGATGVLIGLVAPGDAVSFSYGGGTDFRPTLVIQQALSGAIKAQLAASMTVNTSFSPAAGIPLIGSMASTSARGPSVNGQTIKPEIGAPGSSVSAVAGTGSGEEAFGGTSGATPMVAGAAALLLQAYPNRSPERIKAMLMNSAENVVYTNPALLPGELAPITRVGAGELRVDRAISRNTVAYHRETKSAALSFGAHEVSDRLVLEKKLRVENLGHFDKVFNVAATFRYADDQASGAVKVQVKSTLRVGRFDREDLEVKLIIDPTKLPAWLLNGGSEGGNGAALNGPEFDGYITLTAGSEKISVPWHVLPRKAAETSAGLVQRGKPGPLLKLRNRGLDAGDYDVFSLAGVSRRIPRSELPGAGDNFAVIDMRSVGVRFLPDSLTGIGADILEFAINTNGRRAHPNYPAEFDIYIDVNGDGADDYVVFNAENGGFGATGQNLAFLVDLNEVNGPARAFFFTDADLNSGNVILTVALNVGPGSITLSPGATIGFNAYAFDNYFTGGNTDAIEGMRFTPGLARFGVVGAPFGTVDARGSASVGVTTATLPNSQSSELGLLMMYRRNAGIEADAILIH